MKTNRINWKLIENTDRRNELKKLAARMRKAGYVKIQLNYHGCNTYSIDGFNGLGGVWVG